ncbi:RNA-directed DNA polymerase, eukaryota, reverse transcriptase zinc-binding domain protein [Tanacetum coccineum]
MGEWSLSNAKNLSRILTCFHLASGLRVNFNKSKLFGIGVTNLELNTIASSIGCLASQFPCSLIGKPKLFPSVVGSLLLDPFLVAWEFTTSQPSKLRKRLFASLKVLGDVSFEVEALMKRKYHGLLWNKVESSTTTKHGDGSVALKASNQSLLAKWWRIRNEEHALWSKVICSLHGHMEGLVEDSGSVIATTCPWSQIRKLKIHLNTIRINLPLLFKKKVGNGRNTSFWHDKWLASDRNTSVPRVSSSEVSESSLVRGPSFGRRSKTIGPIINWSWSRLIRSGHEFSELAELMSLLTHFNHSDEQDSWEFIIDPSRQFYVKAIRNHISISTSLLPPHPTNWNKMLPSKVNILLWRVMNRRIPTRINLDMRGIDLDTLRCPVCDNDLESEDHISPSVHTVE